MKRVIFAALSLLALSPAAFAGSTAINCPSLGYTPVQKPQTPSQVPIQKDVIVTGLDSLGQKALALASRANGGGQENAHLVGLWLVKASGPLDQAGQAFTAALDATDTPEYFQLQQQACQLKTTVATAFDNAHIFFELPPSGANGVTLSDLQDLRCELESLASGIGCGNLFLQH